MDSLVGKISLKKENRLLEVITEYRSANVVVGGKVYISAEDAKVILSRTQSIVIPSDEGSMTSVHTEHLAMLYECRDLLRQFAKGVLHTPSTDSTIGELLNKYI